MGKLIRFIFSKKFLFNLIAIALVWLIVIFGTKFYLNKYTHFGQQIEVPSFYKIHMDDLDQLIEGRDIRYEIVDSVYMDEWPKGTVCWQHPKPTDSTGQFVKAGRVIQLSVVPSQPKLIKVPNVVEKSKRMAETQLESMGLRTKVSYKPSSDGKDHVLEQKVNGKPWHDGVKVIKGTVIELVVSKGSSGEVTALPNLVGLTIFEARERLSNLSLSLHPECSNCATVEEIDAAVITQQTPAGGIQATVAAGTTVMVWAEKQ